MNTTDSGVRTALPRKIGADALLNAAVKFWFLVAVLGQWIFVYYVSAFYGGTALQGEFARWNEVLPHGYVEGETMGNLAVALHILLAVIIIVGGPLQLIPQTRTYAPSFHRWNGRLYVMLAFLISVDGLYMVWTRGTISGLVGDISVSINAVLIMLCAALAWRYAVAKNFPVHRRWTLRLFLVVNGVWFFRIGLMFWLFVNGAPVGFDPETFRGPFLTFLGFAQYLLPLAILELYLAAQRWGGTLGKTTMAITLFVITMVTGVGIFAATTGMWLPRL
ncbi:DUF2306 domain-containing protein [Flavobacteriaceae bacterium 3-367]